MELSNVTSFVGSPGNADGVFRLAQYALRLLAATRSSSELAADLLGIVGAIDSARTCNRAFGALEAAEGLMVLQLGAKGQSLRHILALLQDFSMLIYHPIEHHYWLSNHAPSGRYFGHPTLTASRMLSALSLFWIGCGGTVVYLDLVQARRRLGAAQRAAVDAWASSDVGSARCHEAAVAEARAACNTASRRIVKLALDSVMAFHWTLEHPVYRLSPLQLGAVGTASSLLALQASWARHAKQST